MKNKKINVGIIFGGKSVEHEVSLQSAKNVFKAIDRKKYNPILIGINKSGEWLLINNHDFFLRINELKSGKINKFCDLISLVPEKEKNVFILSGNKTLKINVFFPILHGPLGEDGTIQGLLKIINIPFVGAGVLGSSIGMDKDVMKRLLRDAKIPIADFIVLESKESFLKFELIKKRIGLPFFVKPANSGSSIGINKVNNKKDYLNSVKKAFRYDNKVLIEEYIDGREIECSILGNNKPIASVLGEIKPIDAFYSYKAKYISKNGAVSEVPARISKKETEEMQKIAINVFKTLSCEGMARVDFFLKKNGNIIVNEINTIPGFTKISMYPKLWESSGISYTKLIDKLIQLSIDRFKKNKKIKTNYIP